MWTLDCRFYKQFLRARKGVEGLGCRIIKGDHSTWLGVAISRHRHLQGLRNSAPAQLQFHEAAISDRRWLKKWGHGPYFNSRHNQAWHGERAWGGPSAYPGATRRNTCVYTYLAALTVRRSKRKEPKKPGLREPVVAGVRGPANGAGNHRQAHPAWGCIQKRRSNHHFTPS